MNYDRVKLLKEHDQSAALNLSAESHQFLEDVINADGKTRIGVAYDREGNAYLQTGSHVGIVALPENLVLEILPKAAGKNLLPLLQCAYDVESQIFESQVDIKEGSTFLDAIGVLYLNHLENLLTKGLNREYIATQGVKENLRGRWNIQRQIQQESVASTRFTCDYQEYTADNLLNRGVLFATHLLTGLVDNSDLASRLKQRRELLRSEVPLSPVRAQALQDVILDRTIRHYREIRELATLIIDGLYVDDLRMGERSSYGMLINMNEVFEKVVEHTFRKTVQNKPEWSVEGQATTDELFQESWGPNLRPDVLVKRDGKPVLVADAKWKTPKNQPNASDLEQITAYQASYDIPGMLVYPSAGQDLNRDGRVKNGNEVYVRELPVKRRVESGQELSNLLTREVSNWIPGFNCLD
jgi:5-methylcytosine-specific restriction enzyme subunit McrC